MTPPHPSGGETEEEKQHVDVLENHLMDLRMNFARLCYNPDFVSGWIPPDPGIVPTTWDKGPSHHQHRHIPCLPAVRG